MLQLLLFGKIISLYFFSIPPSSLFYYSPLSIFLVLQDILCFVSSWQMRVLIRDKTNSINALMPNCVLCHLRNWGGGIFYQLKVSLTNFSKKSFARPIVSKVILKSAFKIICYFYFATWLGTTVCFHYLLLTHSPPSQYFSRWCECIHPPSLYPVFLLEQCQSFRTIQHQLF